MRLGLGGTGKTRTWSQRLLILLPEVRRHPATVTVTVGLAQTVFFAWLANLLWTTNTCGGNLIAGIPE